ncbi:MAG TPA: hypothetical protein VG940_09270 [Gemmatimonadales bacterium]|nr:hypothetical protein [Gemmatimonadales bacterium]
MFPRALAVWGLLLLLAVLNGGLRERWLVPALGPLRAHQVSTLLLAALILGATWCTIRWIGPGTRRDALTIGALWLGLTLAFEFLAGHFLFHRPWPALLADYDLSQGRIWILVPVVTFLAPTLCRRAP